MALGCENNSSSRDSLPGSYRAKRKTTAGDELESNNLETLGWRGGWGWRGVRGGIDPTLGQTLKALRCLRHKEEQSVESYTLNKNIEDL